MFKKCFLYFIAIVFAYILSFPLHAQGAIATLRVMNVVQPGPDNVTFEAWLKNCSANPLQYYAGQYAFDINKSVLKGKTDVAVIASGLPESYRPRNPVIDTSRDYCRILFAANKLPGIGNDFTINQPDSVLICRAEIKCDKGFYAAPLNLAVKAAYGYGPASAIFIYNGIRAKNIMPGCRVLNDYAPLTLTGIKEPYVGMKPNIFALNQNYPNPFNPATVINYQIPSNCMVAIKVYDVLGREIATPVQGDMKAGFYSAHFDGSKLSSGVYICRMIADGNGARFVSVKKMLLVK
jgi:hypothetical protein